MPSSSTPSKKKRLLFATAIFLLPAAGLAFALFTLVHRQQKPLIKTNKGSAFNTQLPPANVTQTEKNKLQLYMQAQEDSIRKSQESAKDPYQIGSATPPHSPVPSAPVSPGKLQSSTSSKIGAVTSPFPDDNDKKVTDRLQKIYDALNHGRPIGSDPEHNLSNPTPSYSQSDPVNSQASRLEKLMQAFQKSDTAPNPQLEQVKQVLDEIKEIQHPASNIAPPKYSDPSAYPMLVSAQPNTSSDAENFGTPQHSPNAFFGLDDTDDTSATGSETRFEAVVHADQVVQTGSVVKFRLLQPIYLGNKEIPANSFIYGPASISGERVTVNLSDIAYNGQIYPISMNVFDASDGLEGLFVPGMITRDAVKQGMAQGIGGMTIGTLDQSVGAQTAAAAIETTRNLLSRKVALVKATLKAGHRVILKPTINSK